MAESLSDLIWVIKNGRRIQITRKNFNDPNFMRENECYAAEADDFADILDPVEESAPELLGDAVTDTVEELEENLAVEAPAPTAKPKAKPGPKKK